jgi:hypothetical protein
MLSNIFNEMRVKEVKNTVGTICENCNRDAYYFNTKNTKLHTKKTCLICSEKHERGVILEDFIFTLSGHIPKHYEYIEKDISESISLRKILQRFTYDDDQVLEKLTYLLCNEKPSFFKKKGKYKSSIDDALIERYKKNAIDEWHDISKEVKHTRRFTNNKATVFYESLIETCMFSVEKDDIEFNSALTKIEKGTSLFRGRIVNNDTDRNTIKLNPEKELSAPPENLAASNRMSPSGISFMYTAGDYSTAIAELRPYVSDTIAIGEFVATKDLNFFDFTLLDTMRLKEPNLLANPKNNKFFQNGYLLHQLHKLVSKPVRPTDISYIELQIFAETIRNYKDGMFNGIIFESSQRSKGLNYVLFGDYDEAKKDKDYYVALDSDYRVEFYKVKEVITTTERVNENGADVT